MQDLRIALIFGLTVFSGAGCISIGVLIRDKLKTITKVYIVVLLLATLATIALPLLAGLLFPYFYLFSALILISLGIELIGVNLDIRSTTILKVGLLVSLLYSLTNLSITSDLRINYSALSFVAISVGIGYIVTLTGSLILSKRINLRILRIFSGVCLILLGIKILGLPIHSNLILLIYATGIIISARFRMES